MSEVKQLDVTIMGREFRVACPQQEEATLLQAVSMLDGKMHEIRDAGKVVGMEKIAIMAALNIAHEYLHLQLGGFDIGGYQRKLTDMERVIDRVLEDQGQLF